MSDEPPSAGLRLLRRLGWDQVANEPANLTVSHFEDVAKCEIENSAIFPRGSNQTFRDHNVVFLARNPSIYRETVCLLGDIT
jgi:hypothetical protein